MEQLLGVGATTVVDALGALTEAEKLEIRRVVRVHFYLSAQTAVDGSHIHGRFGLIIANDDAIATGAGALPSPIADSDQSWMINDFHENERINDIFRVRHDLKAGRHIRPGTSLAFLLQSDSASDTSTHWTAAMRILIEHR